MAAALVATTGAFAKKVKIQVDMTGQTISANGVHVAGNFQGWSPSATALTKEGSTDLYSTVVDINAMQVILLSFQNIKTLPDCALSIGNFDGIHYGHRELLKRLRKEADARNLRASLLTFEPHSKNPFNKPITTK